MSDLAERLQEHTRRIRAAAESAGRDPADVEMLPITKYASSEALRELHGLGYQRMGESRLPTLTQKASDLADLNIEWVQIGHLQRNKVRPVLALVSEVQSVDSLRLAQAINTAAEGAGVTVQAYVQVNASGEEAKSGFPPDQVLDALPGLHDLAHIRWLGFMTMAAISSDPEVTRATFRRVRELRDQAVEAGFDMPHLSMGMSHDYPIAIAEGATCVRLGSALFG